MLFLLMSCLKIAPDLEEDTEEEMEVDLDKTREQKDDDPDDNADTIDIGKAVAHMQAQQQQRGCVRQQQEQEEAVLALEGRLKEKETEILQLQEQCAMLRSENEHFSAAAKETSQKEQEGRKERGEKNESVNTSSPQLTERRLLAREQELEKEFEALISERMVLEGEKNAFAEKEARVLCTRAEIEEDMKDLLDFKAELDCKEQEMKAKEKKIEEMSAKLKGMPRLSVLQRKDEELAEKDMDIESFSKACLKREASILEREDRVSEKEVQLAEQREELAAQELAVRAREAAIGEVAEEVKMAQMQLENKGDMLNKALADLQEEQNQLNEEKLALEEAVVQSEHCTQQVALITIFFLFCKT